MNFPDVLRTAHGYVVDAKLPASLQPVAFAKAVDFLMGANGDLSRRSADQESSSAEKSVNLAEADLLDKLEKQLGVAKETLAQVYYVDGDQLKLSIRTSDLGDSYWKGTQNVTLLVLAGRQGAELEAVTPQKVIRTYVEDMRQIDPKNFAAAISAMKEHVTVRGTGAARGLVLKPRGYLAASEFIQRLSGNIGASPANK